MKSSRAMQRLGSLFVFAMSLAACPWLTGCQNFFVCEKASCTNSSSGTTTNTGNFAYVSNSTSGSTYLAAYNIGSGALTAIGTPFSLGYIPVAMKVSPNNAFLYVGAGNGGIYLYTISSTGALSGGSTPQITTGSGSISSMDISPDGNFLFVMDGTGLILNEYTLNKSTGALTGPTNFSTPGTSGCSLTGTPVSQSCTVAVSPNNNFVAVALGVQGTVIYPYTSSSGITNAAYTAAIPCCSNGIAAPSGDFSLAFDTDNYLYIARTVALSSYANVGASSPTYEGSVTYASQVTPRSVTVASISGTKYIYTANEGASTLSGFSVSGTAQLTALSSTASAGPTNVSAVAVDKTGTYLIAAGYSASTGVQLFKLSSGTVGTAVASAGTGTSTAYPALLALTH